LGIFTSKTLCTTAETGSPRNPTIDEQSSKIANRVRVGPADCYSTADTGSSSSDATSSAPVPRPVMTVVRYSAKPAATDSDWSPERDVAAKSFHRSERSRGQKDLCI
jgi:hypothetical protein